MKNKLKIIILLVTSVVGVLVIVALFISSEKVIHHENTFIRRFPPHSAQEEYKFDLKYNSYYFAGTAPGKIFLGNYTTPLVLTIFDTLRHTTETAKVELTEKHLPFHKPLIKVHNDHFFVFEGSVPYIFQGSTKSWVAKLRKSSGNYFSQLGIIDSVNVAVRFIDPQNGQSIIGKINLSDTTNVNLGTTLLQKQIDGIFDTDGELHYNTQQQRINYIYRYRNQFIVADHNLKVDYRVNTIDTVSRANLKLQNVESRNYKTFVEPPLVVNRHSTAYGDNLFVHSTMRGRYERDYLWKHASIIDVYNMNSKTYRSSFPIYNIDDVKMKSFLATDKKIYALIANQLVCYKLLPHMAAEVRN